MTQVVDMYIDSSGSLAARLDDGEIRTLSKCESVAILQNAKLPEMNANRRKSRTSKGETKLRQRVRVTATLTRTISTTPLRMAA